MKSLDNGKVSAITFEINLDRTGFMQAISYCQTGHFFRHWRSLLSVQTEENEPIPGAMFYCCIPTAKVERPGKGLCFGFKEVLLDT